MGPNTVPPRINSFLQTARNIVAIIFTTLTSENLLYPSHGVRRGERKLSTPDSPSTAHARLPTPPSNPVERASLLPRLPSDTALPGGANTRTAPSERHPPNEEAPPLKLGALASCHTHRKTPLDFRDVTV